MTLDEAQARFPLWSMVDDRGHVDQFSGAIRIVVDHYEGVLPDTPANRWAYPDLKKVMVQILVQRRGQNIARYWAPAERLTGGDMVLMTLAAKGGTP